MRYDFVLLDTSLPDIDGIEIARKIREKYRDSLQIIGLTSIPLDDLKQQFPSGLAHFTEICIKPLDYEMVFRMLQNSLPVYWEKKNAFHHLISEYQATIPDRIELLRNLIQEMKEKPNEKTLKELRLQVHKLAGNAGLYGYNEVSQICKDFDKLLTKDIEDFKKYANTPEKIETFHTYLEKIKKAFKSNAADKGKLEQKIVDKKAVIGVIGLGNIGLSLLDAFGKAGFPLVGYDVSTEKMEMLKNRKSYLNYMDMGTLFSMMDENRFHPSSNPKILETADVIIISVPTSIDRYGTPNLSNLRAAFGTVATFLKKQQLVVLQSSTYPGTTREELLPLLLKSNLKVGVDFYLAHVPEIADIGNQDFNFVQMPRIVSGITPQCLKNVSLLYENMSAKIIPCSSTEVAEAAKLLQNAFRLINISFINEMKMLLDTMFIDIWEVIAAAATKPFGFMPFYPSPGIGGDCIPIAPFYLVWKAKASGGPTTMLEDAKRINDGMPHYVINKLLYGLNLQKKTIRDAKILILGASYKKDVNDTRESIALKVIPILTTMLADVSYHDPYVKTISNFPEYPELTMKSINFDYDNLKSYDAVVILTDHSFYDWAKIVKHSNLVVDTRNVSAKLTDTKNVVKA
jgi:UDP-N-acetyl-D-glucosamine dehydrogenase